MIRRLLRRAGFGAPPEAERPGARRSAVAPPLGLRGAPARPVPHVPSPAEAPRASRSYTLSRPHLATWPEEAFHPDFLSALRVGGDGGARAVHPRLFALTPLSPARVRDLCAEVGRFHAWARATGVPVEPPNSMNTYGVTLETLGIDPGPLLRALAPVAARHFRDLGGASLDHAHAFVVSYARGRDVDLGFHADDAEVTLNLCLGESFTGGDLYFEGLRCEAHRQTGCSETDRFLWQHAPGTALLHAGAHRHGALPISNGSRHNLIVWMRSTAARAASDEGCPEWCRESRGR